MVTSNTTEPKARRSRALSNDRATGGPVLAYPIATTLGAVAVAVGLAWFIPSGKRERRLLAGTAKTIAPFAQFAVAAATEAGKRKADELARDAFATVGQGLLAAVVPEPATPATA